MSILEHQTPSEDWQRVLEGRKVLQVGDVGAGVSALQERLIRAGYPLDITGVFGPETQRAVLAFQTQFGIPSTGRMGGRTSRILENHDNTRWEHVLADEAVLAIGSESLGVRTLQEFLCRKGLMRDVTGVFGPTTRERVLEFQRASGLDPTGEVDRVTARALQGDPPEPVPVHQERDPDLTDREEVADGEAIVVANPELSREVVPSPPVDGTFPTERSLTRMIRAARAEGIELTRMKETPAGSRPDDPTHRSVILDDGQKQRWLRRNARLFGFVSTNDPWIWKCGL
jgi:peptidoglycan hydrolase-like protein with peptidoglycan-binding domain